MRYRFRLGKKNDTINVVRNGTFDSSLTNWDYTFDWSWDAGRARCNWTPDPNSYIRQDCLELGEEYAISFDIVQTIGDEALYLFVGDWSKTDRPIDTGGRNTIIQRAISGTTVGFRAVGDTLIDNVAAYKRIWNDPVKEPLEWNESKITKERDTVLNGFYVKYIESLTFHSDGYSYLKSIKEEDGICGEVPLQIEYQCEDGGEWAELFRGVIYISECEWDLSKCQVLTRPKDEYSQHVVRNRDVEVEIYRDLAPDIMAAKIMPFPSTTIEFFDSNYTSLGIRRAFYISDLFEYIIAKATNYEIAFESELFTTGEFGQVALTFGADLVEDYTDFNQDNYHISFNDLFANLEKWLNLTHIFYLKNNVPTIKIERKQDVLGSTASLVLNKVSGITEKTDDSTLVKTIRLGSKKLYFAESDGLQFYTKNRCSDVSIDMTSDIIADSNSILGMLGQILSEDNLTSEPDFYAIGSWQVLGDWVMDININFNIHNVEAFSSGSLTQPDILTPGKRYRFEFEIFDYVNGSVEARAGTASGGTFSGNGVKTVDIVCTESKSATLLSANFAGKFQYFKVYEYVTDKSLLEEMFIVETYAGAATMASTGGVYYYNDNLILRAVARDRMLSMPFRTMYYIDQDTGVETSVTAPTIRLLPNYLQFSHPLKWHEFQSLDDFGAMIEINSVEQAVINTMANVLKASYDVKTGLTEFEVISE